jgi:hypothetical protein
MWSYDGIWNLFNGRKGVAWDLDENNEPYLTQLGWEIKNGAKEFPNGGKLGNGLYLINSFGISPRMPHPVYKRQIDTMDWIKKPFAPADDNLTADWKAVMNAKDDIDYFIKNKMVSTNESFAQGHALPEDMMETMNRVGEVIKAMSWQAVYAKDEAEFNRIWEEMRTRANGMGFEAIVKWSSDDWFKADADLAKYKW